MYLYICNNVVYRDTEPTLKAIQHAKPAIDKSNVDKNKIVLQKHLESAWHKRLQ